MRCVRVLLLVLGIALAGPAAAQSGADLERANAALARAVAMKLESIGKRSTYADRVAAARSRFETAQREWERFRDAECAARAAIDILISARTLEALTLICLLSVTEQRIRDLKE